MITRIRELTSRLRPVEIAAIALVLLAPVVIGTVIAISAMTESTGILVVVGLYYLATIMVIVLAVTLRLRFRTRQLVAEQAAADAAEVRASGALAGTVPDWIDTTSPDISARRVIAAAARLDLRALHIFGARSRSMWAREVYAHVLTEGRLTYGELERGLRASNDGEQVDHLLLGQLDLNLLIGLARFVLAQVPDEDDEKTAGAILEYIARKLPESRMSYGNRVLLAERLVRTGRDALAFEVLKDWATSGFTERQLAADLLNPWVETGPSPTEASVATWLAAFNSIHRPYGLEPVALDGTGETPYDRLSAHSNDRVTDGPLISVLMTCFKPDRGLITSVRSMIAQTWTNWELLILDDASPEEFTGVLGEVAEMDSRVRVIRAEHNAGTYVRRNDGIDAARGEFVTMQDSDDWVHPRRLEVQARHLLANSEVIANTSKSLRVTENLRFVQPRGLSIRMTESSLMFRKKRVIERVGYYDAVRKGADSEYRQRLEAAFDQEIPLLETGGPLALIRFTSGSLSGSDFRDGWKHPARVGYGSAFERWHRGIRAGSMSPYLPHPLVDRPFPVHPYLLGEKRTDTEFDVVVMFDGREGANPRGTLRRIATELAQLSSRGQRVAVAHLDSLTSDRSTLGVFPDILQEHVSQSRVTRVSLDDTLTVGTVIVRTISALHGYPDSPSPIKTSRVILVEDLVSGRDRRGENFTERDVVDVARSMFGVEPETVTIVANATLRSLIEGTASRS